MVDRVSALDGHYPIGRFGAEGEIGVTLAEVRDLILYQVAAWPDTCHEVGWCAVKSVKAESVPGPCQSVTGPAGAVLRVEPLKWWVYGGPAPHLESRQGMTLDLSHSRVQLSVSGNEAKRFLNRLIPLDFREPAFPVGFVASSLLHHVSVTLWRTDDRYVLFIPRGFALSLWEVMLETAAQFGAEIV